MIFFRIYSITSDVIQWKEQNQPFSISRWCISPCTSWYVIFNSICVTRKYFDHSSVPSTFMWKSKYSLLWSFLCLLLSLMIPLILIHRENKMIYRGKETDCRLLLECQVVTCYAIFILITTLSNKSHAQFEQMWKDWWDLWRK